MTTTTCHECDETVRGAPGAVGQCAYCGTWLDMPEAEGCHSCSNVATRTDRGVTYCDNCSPCFL